MSYVDGFVCAMPMANRGEVRTHAEVAAPVFKEHGALKVVECWGDDVPDGKLTSFPMAFTGSPPSNSRPVDHSRGARCRWRWGRRSP